jgi:hypothetical protein
LTITLNLMVADADFRIRDQYFFDLASRTIASYPHELPATARVSLLSIAGYLGNADTTQLLSDLSEKHPCRRTRLTAFEAWSRQQPQGAMSIWERAVADKAPLVVNAARRRLRELESA